MRIRSDSSLDFDAIEGVIVPVCRAHGVELVDVQWASDRGGSVLRVLIDRERDDLDETVPGSGVSLSDCQSVSRDLSTTLDVHDRLVPSGRYRLEVSSPGVDRPLVRWSDFERFVGKELRVQTRVPLTAGERKKFQGVLVSASANMIQMEDGGEHWEVPFELISKANLVYRFAEKAHPKGARAKQKGAKSSGARAARNTEPTEAGPDDDASTKAPDETNTDSEEG